AAAILLSIKDETAFEAALLESLELLGHCVDADRMHIWRCETAPGASRFILQHQWEGDGARDKVCVFPGTSVPRGALSEWEDTLSRGECVNIIISELPPERHGFFSGFDLRSLALLPLFRRNQLWGLLAIDDCRRERIFSAEEIGILRSAGLMILSAIHRNEMLSTIRSDGEKTRAQAHWYKSILDAIPLPLSITDADMNWTFVNTAVESFLERRREDMLGRHCSHWDAHICNTAHCGIACVKRGEHRTFFKQKGLSFQVDVEILKDLEGKTTGYIEVVQDITQIEEMARRQVEVEAANKAKSTFLATMSHEIRTPINAILGISEIQLQHRSLLPETREAFSEIYDSGHWLLNIINDILDLSKIEAGKLELMPVKYDIPSLINDTVQLNRLRYESKPIDFKLHVDPDTPIDLIGDELRIKQILNNLLSNAFKYTDAGEIALSISALTEETEGAGTTLVLRVSDTGQGMTESQIAEIFDEYTRFNMDLNRATVGTGLGMNITKRLTDLMHGEISVESTVGEGTVFIVSLPQERVGTALCGEELAEQLRKFRFPGAAKMKMAQIMREYMPYGSVLVVDDVESNLYVARGLLLPYGLRVDSAVNGVAALEKIRSGNRYDIVFMDHMMPKMDGIETTKRLRGMGYTDPVVALTANALAGQAEMFMANGFDGFISKPIDSRELNAVLNTLIRDKQPPGVIEAARKEQERGQPQTDASESKKPLNREIARFFVKDAENAAATLEEIYAREDAGGKMHIYTATAHGVKSALANVGENELSAVAYKLEQAGRGQDMGAIIAETPAFLDALRALIAKIKPVTEIAEAEASGEDLDYLRYKLAGIKAACAVFDKKAVRAALNDLDKKVWPRRIREALDAVAAHLLHSDFPQAAQTADRIIAEIN
ncbi:MAG: ATP-binding protein, partial [Oscillospiraceae bacterium]|nr:ATP-binding protein [Oscillospiraceae bacterium]